MDRALESLTRPECLELLATAVVGRFVFTLGGLPAVQPVNYLLDQDRIVFRTREGSKLVAVRKGTVVAFEVDEIDPESRTGWSVTVVGNARLLDQAEGAEYRDRVETWMGDERNEVVVIETTLVTGRRIVGSGSTLTSCA